MAFESPEEDHEGPTTVVAGGSIIKFVAVGGDVPIREGDWTMPTS